MIHVLIERCIADDMLATYERNARYALQQTYTVPGFIAGEAFSTLQAPNHRFLLCQWRSPLHWRRWYESAERQELMNMIAPILQEPEKITMLNSDSSAQAHDHNLMFVAGR